MFTKVVNYLVASKLISTISTLNEKARIPRVSGLSVAPTDKLSNTFQNLHALYQEINNQIMWLDSAREIKKDG
jgi:hypothetical protein